MLSVGGGVLLDRLFMVFHECVCYACDHSVHISVPSISFVYVCVCPVTHLIWVFALLMLFLCVILHTMWLDKSLQLLCILPFSILCLSSMLCCC